MSFDKFGQRENLNEWSQKIGDLMDEMFNRSFVGFRDSGVMWEPHVNVYETPPCYFICVDLAGVDQQQIDVQSTQGNRITIAGTRSQPRPPGGASELSVHVMEVSEGTFRREIDLPEAVDVDGIEASYSKGFLWITLPRKKGG